METSSFSKLMQGGKCPFCGQPLVIRSCTCQAFLKRRTEAVAESEADHLENIKAQKRKAIAEITRRTLHDCGLDAYVDSSLDDLQEIDGNQRALKVSRRFAEIVGKPDATPDDTRAVIMFGPTGRGKTALATAIMNRAIQRGKTVGYMSCRYLLNYFVWNDSSEALKSAAAKKIERCENCDLLVIDDFGYVRASPRERSSFLAWFTAEIDRISNTTKNLILTFETNSDNPSHEFDVAVHDISDYGADSTLSRLRGIGHAVMVGGPDWREPGKQGRGF